MRFEEEYGDVLQNIEAMLVRAYRDNPNMSDWDTMDVLDALIRTYRAEMQERPAPEMRAHSPAQEDAYRWVRSVCEWRLGREELHKADTGQSVDLPVRAITEEEIVACLKRIRRSVKKWNKHGGRRGYFDFVSQFIT